MCFTVGLASAFETQGVVAAARRERPLIHINRAFQHVFS